MGIGQQPTAETLIFLSEHPDDPVVIHSFDKPAWSIKGDDEADEGSVTVFLVEPISWGAIGWAVVSGILAWIGGQAFQAAIGKKPIEDLIRLAVEAIQAFVSQRLDQETIDVVTGHVNAGFTHLIDLETMDDAAVIKAKIVAADERALDAIKILEKKGTPAFGAYTAAVTLRLFCLAAYSRFANQRGLAKVGSRKTVEESLPHASKLLAEIVDAADRKITSVTKVEVSSYRTAAAPLDAGDARPDGPGDRIGRELWYRYEFKDNGRAVSVGGFVLAEDASRAGAKDRAARINGHKKYRQDLQANVVLPSQKTFDEWQKVAAYFEKAAP